MMFRRVYYYSDNNNNNNKKPSFLICYTAVRIGESLEKKVTNNQIIVVCVFRSVKRKRNQSAIDCAKSTKEYNVYYYLKKKKKSTRELNCDPATVYTSLLFGCFLYSIKEKKKSFYNIFILSLLYLLVS